MSSDSIRVLFVEDSVVDAKVLCLGLERASAGHFQVAHVRRLGDALEYLWEKPCSVVLLDLGLPDSHGIDTLVLLRAQAPAVPIVVLTGLQDEAVGDQALKEGAQDYLVKGQADGRQVARSLRYAIARKAAEEAVIRQGVAVAKAGELRRSRQRLLAVHERVRRDVAAQLRDGLQEKLLILKGQLQELLKGTNSPAQAPRVVSEVIQGLNQVIEPRVIALSRQLYPLSLSHGLILAFQSFPERFGAGLVWEMELDEALWREEKAGRNPVPEQVGLAAYRIAEEALTNVVKHAKASKVTVRVDRPRECWLRLTVRDDGQGFDAERGAPGLGMATVQDYAGNVEGECVVHSAPGMGTEVTAVFPLSRLGTAHPETLEKGVFRFMKIWEKIIVIMGGGVDREYRDRPGAG
jgi:signal transduction histidine kinase